MINRDDIIRMAREANGEEAWDGGVEWVWAEVERFAALVAAAELRRLHEEVQQWQEKCNTYIEIHDAVVKDNERLHEVNAELVEALRQAVKWGQPFKDAPRDSRPEWFGIANAALRKAQGENNDSN